MFKALPYIVKLHIYKHVDHRVNHVAHFSQTNSRTQKTTYSQVQERDPCKHPDPCPPPPKDDRAFWGAMAVLFTTGCFAVYAKNSPECRDWLSIHAPWFDDFVAVLYQENKSYGQHAVDFVGTIQEYMRGPPRLCDSEGRPIKQPPKEKKKAVMDVVCPKPEDQAPPDVKVCPEAKKPEVSLKNICDIEKCLLLNGETCLNNYWTAKEACRVYNQLVEDNLFVFSYDRLKALRPAMMERYKLLNEHVCAAEKSLHTLHEVGRIMECGVSAPKDAVDNINNMLKEYLARVKVMQTEYVWEVDRSVSMDEKWQSMERIVDHYIQENQTMFSGTKYDSEKPSIIASGVDLHLIHTIKNRNKLEAELKAGVQAASERTDRSLETLPQDEKSGNNRNALIQAEYKKKQAALEESYRKRIDWQKAEVDKELKQKQKELKEKHERELVIKLEQKEKEATKNLDKMVKEAVDAQKKEFARQLRDLSLKVKAVEHKLEARLKAEREQKRSQQLYSAGASLLNATKKGDEHVCVAREIRAIEAAVGDGDKLVETVLKSIPEQVRKEGLVPESVLRQRYHLMEKTAKDVALVEREGSPMPVYIVSWLQSALLFMKLSGIPQEDIDKPMKCKKELEDLDTFDRLNYARYWIEKGNLAPALRYVDSLEGASRVAADQWYKDAKSHLEIKQAAEAVIAHAAALGLQYT